MNTSDTSNTGGTATFIIKVNGSALPEQLSVYSLQIQNSVNRIPSAKIVLMDGAAMTGKFEASSSAAFVPGATISIEAGYDTQNEVIFEGIITSQSLKIGTGLGAALEIECRDRAISMIVGRKSRTYHNKKDSEIITDIIKNYTGLSADTEATTTVWPEQVQYYATDWDYILTRAEANGFIVTAVNGKISLHTPNAASTSVFTVTYGTNLLDFNAKLNAVTQVANVTSKSWDYKNQTVIQSEAVPTILGAGALTTLKLAEVIGLDTYQQQTTAPLDAAELSNWSKAQISKSEYSKIQGTATIQGTSAINPGKYVAFTGLGAMFNGTYLIGGVTHNFADGNWTTALTLGLSPNWFSETTDVTAPPASGLIPAARGLFNGIVTKISEDPESQYRILVAVPLFDENESGIWARLSNFYATHGAGAFFLPEVGDEVILGFLNEDPRYPIILGSLYSGTKNTPATGLVPNENNSIKAIVSKSGIAVTFDDENKIWSVRTPNQNTITMSERDKQIAIKDQNENSIVLSASGIDISSAKSITISASETVSIKGTLGINMQSSAGDVTTTGLNIKESAAMQYKAQGAMTAEVSGGAQLTLKGAMVQIN